MTLSTLPMQNGHPGDPVEDRLRAFFRQEMPHPWPRFAYPEEDQTVLHSAKTGLSRRPLLRQPLVRLALAASILLVALGYLGLARFFPGPTGGNSHLDSSREVGSKVQRVVTPGGREAWMQESIQNRPGKQPTIILDLKESGR